MKSLISSFLLIAFNIVQLKAQIASGLPNTVVATVIDDEGNITLQWDLQREVNTSYFCIEQLNQYGEFEIISTQRASGYSYRSTSYFSDIEIDEDVQSEFRITLVTMEGRRISSNVVIISNSSNQREISLVD